MELLRTLEKTRNAILEAAKALPQQLRAQTIELPKVELTAFGMTLVSMPKRTIDLTKLELPKAEVFTDKLGQVKVLAPIDLDGIQARVSDAAEMVQKFAAGTTAKAKGIVDDLKTRPILFVPARTPAQATKKPATKKAKAPAKKTEAAAPTNGSAPTA